MERGGEAEAAIVDILDYRILRAVTRHSSEPHGEVPLVTEPTEKREAAADVQQWFDHVLGTYLSGDISLGRVAELLGRPYIELRERFAKLGVPLRLAPSTENELREDIRTMEAWLANRRP